MSNLHDTWAIQRAVNQLNYDISVGDVTLTADQRDLWDVVVAAVSLNTIPKRLHDAEASRVTYNSADASSIGDNRTIPPASGTDSTAETQAEGVTAYNAADPFSYGSISGNSVNVANWFFARGQTAGKNQGWNATYIGIWDKAIAACAEEVSNTIQTIDLSVLPDDYVSPSAVPWTVIASATNQACKQLLSTTTVQHSNPMWMNLVGGIDSQSSTVVATGTYTAA